MYSKLFVLLGHVKIWLSGWMSGVVSLHGACLVTVVFFCSAGCFLIFASGVVVFLACAFGRVVSLMRIYIVGWAGTFG